MQYDMRKLFWEGIWNEPHSDDVRNGVGQVLENLGVSVVRSPQWPRLAPCDRGVEQLSNANLTFGDPLSRSVVAAPWDVSEVPRNWYQLCMLDLVSLGSMFLITHSGCPTSFQRIRALMHTLFRLHYNMIIYPNVYMKCCICSSILSVTVFLNF